MISTVYRPSLFFFCTVQQNTLLQQSRTFLRALYFLCTLFCVLVVLHHYYIYGKLQTGKKTWRRAYYNNTLYVLYSRYLRVILR